MKPAAGLPAAFAEALSRHAAAGNTALAGLEHEYYLSFRGRPRDFRRILHTLPIDGRRLDPGDTNAYRLRSGLALTCDDAEAEVASPPVALSNGFANEISCWAHLGQTTLRRLLPPAVEMTGASTHLSVSVPENLQDQVCNLYTTRFAPALMLLSERPDSHGIMVRPRPGRIELCTEYNTGDHLELLATFAAGSVAACIAAAESGHAAGLPASVVLDLEPCLDRPGVQLRRDAFGIDLLALGRGSALHLDGGAVTTAGEHLCRAARVACDHLAGLVPRPLIARLDVLAGQPVPLPRDAASGRNTQRVARIHRSPFGEVVDPLESGSIVLQPVAATWDFTLYCYVLGPRRAYAAVPRPFLQAFLDQGKGRALRRVLRSYLEAAPSGRRLDCYCQLQEPSLWDEVGPLSGLLRPERFELWPGPGGGSAGASAHFALAVPAAAARAAKAGIPGIPPPPPPPPPPAEPRRPPHIPGPQTSPPTPPPSAEPQRPPDVPGPHVPPPPPPVETQHPPDPTGTGTPPPAVTPVAPARPWKRAEHFVAESPATPHQHVVATFQKPSPGLAEGGIFRRPILGGAVALLVTVTAAAVIAWFTVGGGNGSPDEQGGAQSPSPPGLVTSPTSGQPGDGPSPQSPGAVPVPTEALGAGPSPETPASEPTREEPTAGRAGETPPAGSTEAPPAGSSPITSPTTGTGGGETPAAPATPTPPPTPTPVPVLSGFRSTNFGVLSNPAAHPCVVGPALELRFFITRDRSVEPNPVAITVSGPGIPTMTAATVIGPAFDSQGGTASASGTGVYCNYSTSWKLEFTISPQSVSGTLTVGGEGLPTGLPIVFSFSGGSPH